MQPHQYFCLKCKTIHTFARQDIQYLDDCHPSDQAKRLIYCDHFNYQEMEEDEDVKTGNGK